MHPSSFFELYTKFSSCAFDRVLFQHYTDHSRSFLSPGISVGTPRRDLSPARSTSRYLSHHKYAPPPLPLSSSGVKDLLEIINKGTADPLLSALDGSIRSLLQAWFSVGFLELRRITFEGSGGALLEKIARYVGGIRSWFSMERSSGIV